MVGGQHGLWEPELDLPFVFAQGPPSGYLICPAVNLMQENLKERQTELKA